MVRNFNSDDTGKEVYSADGDMIGTVSEVKGNRLHVTPKGSLSRNIRQMLGWGDDQEEYELRHTAVGRISGDEIHLKENF